MALGPGAGGEAGIDGADGGIVIGVGVEPDTVPIGHVFPDGKTAADIVVVVVAQLIAYIVDVAARGCVEARAQIDTDGQEFMIEPQV